MFRGHQGAVRSLSFSVDGKQLVSGSEDRTARVWDLERAGMAIRPLASSENTQMARFSPDGQLIAAGAGNRLRLWNAATGTLVREFSASGERGSIQSVTFSPTDNRLLAAGYGEKRRRTLISRCGISIPAGNWRGCREQRT